MSPAAAPDDLDPAVRAGPIRDEGGDALVEPKRAAGVGPQRDVRVPAAGHQQQVGLDGLVCAAGPRDADRAQVARVVTARARHEVAGARVDGRHDLHAGRREDSGDPVGRAVVREDDGSLAWRDPVALHVGGCGAREHDPGPVVVGEDDGSFGCAGGDHDPPGPDVPEPALGGRASGGAPRRSRNRGRRCRAPSSRHGRRRRSQPGRNR